MNWEQAYLQATMADHAELQRDIQLLRAMGPMGEFIKGARRHVGGEDQGGGSSRRRARRGGALGGADGILRQATRSL